MNFHRMFSAGLAMTILVGPVHAQQPAPGLEWEQTTIAIETDGSAQPANVVYRFRNTGGSPVNILSANASCGCTVPATSKTAYAPGESGELPVAHKPKPGAGQHVYQINVQTDENGGRAHALTLQVKNNPRIVSGRFYFTPAWPLSWLFGESMS